MAFEFRLFAHTLVCEEAEETRSVLFTDGTNLTRSCFLCGQPRRDDQPGCMRETGCYAHPACMREWKQRLDQAPCTCAACASEPADTCRAVVPARWCLFRKTPRIRVKYYAHGVMVKKGTIRVSPDDSSNVSLLQCKLRKCLYAKDNIVPDVWCIMTIDGTETRFHNVSEFAAFARLAVENPTAVCKVEVYARYTV